jgi:hypothetical protein
MYNPVVALDERNMTIGLRRDDRFDVTPGPGHYDANRSTQLIRPASQAVDFARSYTDISPQKKAVSFV